jgi:hypothetical protein
MSTWMTNFIKTAKDYAALSVGERVTGEDLRVKLTLAVGEPAHPNSYGAAIRRLVIDGVLKPTGDYTPMQAERSHGRKTPVYSFAEVSCAAA